MKRFALTAAVAAAALVATAAPALAGNLSKYDGASWYEKYLSISSAATPVCTGNTGSTGQLAYGNNVDASHECGSQSETFIAINPDNTDNVLPGSNEIQAQPMRPMAPSDGASPFTRS